MRGGSSELGRGRGRSRGGRGGGGGRGRNRNSFGGSDSSASLRQRNTTSVKAAASSSRTVEETLTIVPGEIPPAFGMTIRLAPDLMEEIKRVEAQGGTAKIKFDALPNSSTGNIIHVGGKEFKFTWCKERGNLCDIYEEHQSGEDGIGVLVEAGCAWRKLNVQRTLDESTTSHLKMLSVEAQQRTKSRKLIVLTETPSLKKQLAPAVAPWGMSNKQKKEPPPKKRKVDPAPVVIGGPKPCFRPGASTTSLKNRLSASLGPSPSNQYDTPSSCGTGSIAKTHADNLNVTPVKTRGGESMVASEKDLSTWESNAFRNTSARHETNVNEEIDLQARLVDLLKQAPMSFKALEKAVGNRTPTAAKWIEPILKKIANFQAPSYFLKPGADLESYKKHSTDSQSSPEHQQLPQITVCSRDQLPVPGVSNMENFSVYERKGEGSQDSLDIIMSDGDKEQSAERDAIDLPSAEIEGLKKKLLEVSVSHKSTPTVRDLQKAELQFLEERLQFVKNSTKLFKNRAAYEASQREFLAEEYRRLKLGVGSLNDRVNHLYEYFSGSVSASHKKRKKVSVVEPLVQFPAICKENVDGEKDLPGILHEEKRFENRDGQARSSNSDSDSDNNDSGSDSESSSDSEASSVSKEVSDEDVDIIMSDGDKEQSAERDAIDLPSAEIEGLKKKLLEVSVSHKSTPTVRDLQKAELQFLEERLQFVKNSTKLFKNRVNHLYEYFSGSVSASHKRRKKVSVVEPLVQFPAICKDSQPSERKYDLEHLNASAAQMNPGDSSGKSNKHSDALGNVHGGNDQPDISEKLDKDQNRSSVESKRHKEAASMNGPKDATTKIETAQVSPEETAEPIQVLTESSLILESKSDGVSGESRTENVELISLEKSLMLGDVMEGTDLQDASVRGKYKDVFDGFELLINGSGDLAPESCVNFCEAWDVNDLGYDGMPKKAIDLVQSTVEIPGVADEFQVDSREGDEKFSEITRSKAVTCGVFETNDEEMYDVKISGDDGDNVMIIGDDFPMATHEETHVSHEVLDKRGEGTNSKSNCSSSFEVLNVESGVKENDLTSKNQEKMASQTCIKNKSVPSEEAKATKKEAKARKKITQERIALGVKKLKLKPPVAPRPKPIIFCRHHLKGRCREGEQCKFSHDTTPETKSLPCCYFATQSCMKGDDCPYDHDLSKYPCNNFVTKGFCHRGDTCLFSHKGTPQAASDRPVANVTTSSSNIAAASSSFEALNVESGVKENDLSKNQEKMDSQTCIKNKSVPSKEAKARKKPCRYLATQSCMKGDDCPYDHDLAKYPCTNFVTNGFCRRGDKCLFSHKGEQCKFSHDTTPETKSLPCCYFATQPCMKGNDCPYDHDLLKYPCINFVTNGFCHMGDKCLFSHKAASDRPGENVTISSSNTAAASVLPQKSNKQTVRQAIARLQGIQPRVSSSSTFLKPSSQSNQKNSTDASSSKINEHATPPQLPPLRKPSVVPKGMSFLSFDKTTQEEDTSKKL